MSRSKLIVVVPSLTECRSVPERVKVPDPELVTVTLAVLPPAIVMLVPPESHEALYV
jgi:hypothetical protein